MKKLINAVPDVVKEQLEGMAVAHPDLIKVHFDPNFVYRADAPVQGKVALISGGGSGHEPMHGGFVGMGMLDAACPGEVFTSPTPDQMLEAAKATNSGAGVLYIVKNYTGDVMNFEMAAELAHAEGIQVQNILIDDDVAVKDSLYTAGRRGVGTTVLAEKVCGGAAETVGVEGAAKKVLKMPVRIGQPHGASGLIEEVSGPAYAASIGLLLHGSRLQPERRITLGGARGRVGDLISRMINWVKSYLP